MKSVKPQKILLLFSGGLDSLLAFKILEKEGFQISALAFRNCFGEIESVKKIAQENKLLLWRKNISQKHLALVKNPSFGYGKHLNPCIDCHLLMFKEAKKIAEKKKIKIIASGEVLGQRPMSQNIRQFELIEKLSGLENKILRPLSAQLLPATEYEKRGWILRKNLFNISGKSRSQQLELVKKYKLKKYLTPAGGCLLTDPLFSQRLGQLLTYYPPCQQEDVLLLKSGRIFWDQKNIIVIGRNQTDNQKILRLYDSQRDTLLELRDFKGPLMLIRFLSSQKGKRVLIKKWSNFLGWYYPRIRNQKKVFLKIIQGTNQYQLEAKIERVK